ncbi:hypothetical protein HQ544_05410 [Candidatus Falkowbacteria bacterium]|nr:hypothetical protein [Candidatus Falkowbacteria bacterium]
MRPRMKPHFYAPPGEESDEVRRILSAANIDLEEVRVTPTCNEWHAPVLVNRTGEFQGLSEIQYALNVHLKSVGVNDSLAMPTRCEEVSEEIA